MYTCIYMYVYIYTYMYIYIYMRAQNTVRVSVLGFGFRGKGLGFTMCSNAWRSRVPVRKKSHPSTSSFIWSGGWGELRGFTKFAV